MSRIVAMEEGLESIGVFLKEKGFQVVAWDRRDLPIDAIVYVRQKLEDIQSLQSAATPESFYDYAETASYGVLLVNAQNKTPEDIYEIIKNRSYESII